MHIIVPIILKKYGFNIDEYAESAENLRASGAGQAWSYRIFEVNDAIKLALPDYAIKKGNSRVAEKIGFPTYLNKMR